MIDRSNRMVTLQTLVLVVLITIGIGLRIGRLSWPPLADSEAAAALDAAR